jgi:hypothetical protein
MKKLKIIVSLLIMTLSITSLDTGCTKDAGVHKPNGITLLTTTTTPAISPEIIEEQIVGKHLHVESSFITFSGKAELPDNTVLLSQLYEGDKALSWWPTNMEILVRNGQWEISVDLEQIGRVDNILIGPIYNLKIWQKDNLENKAEMFFDLVGPPRDDPWWKLSVFWMSVGTGIAIIIIIVAVYYVKQLKRRVK